MEKKFHALFLVTLIIGNLSMANKAVAMDGDNDPTNGGASIHRTQQQQQPIANPEYRQAVEKYYSALSNDVDLTHECEWMADRKISACIRCNIFRGDLMRNKDYPPCKPLTDDRIRAIEANLASLESPLQALKDVDRDIVFPLPRRLSPQWYQEIYPKLYAAAEKLDKGQCVIEANVVGPNMKSAAGEAAKRNAEEEQAKTIEGLAQQEKEEVRRKAAEEERQKEANKVEAKAPEGAVLIPADAAAENGEQNLQRMAISPATQEHGSHQQTNANTDPTSKSKRKSAGCCIVQ